MKSVRYAVVVPTAVKSHSEMLHTYRRAEILSAFGVITSVGVLAPRLDGVDVSVY